MKLTATLKLLPTPEQADALKRTLAIGNAACNHISAVAWETRKFGRQALHELVYYDVKVRFGLGAQLAVRCIGKVKDAYKLDKDTQRTFKPTGAIPYDSRMLTYWHEQREVTIWTVDGRLTIPFACGEYHRALLQGQWGESDLVYRKGKFYLYATCEVEEAPQADVTGYLGVDLGIKNIASDSDGKRYSGGKVNGLRKRHFKIRQRLQGKGTKSAKRLLVKRSRKEGRFAKDVNHVISKELVEKAKGTSRGIALEDLTGIRERVTVTPKGGLKGKSQRREHTSWSFYDLRQKIAYKGFRAGVPVVLVDPRNTSRECPNPECGHIDKRNRPSQSKFCCVKCGFSGHADTVAAGNIARRADQSTGQCLDVLGEEGYRSSLNGSTDALGPSPRFLIEGS